MSICSTPDGNDVCSPPEGPTTAHLDCYTGMVDTDDFGDLDGIGCDVGCVSCRDLLADVVNSSTPLTAPGLLGAARFLYPNPDSPDGRVGANNRQFALQASKPEWVKPGALFVLGCCWKNDSHECYGEWSTCSCFNEAVFTTIDGTDQCPDGTHDYNWLSGFFMDRFAYADLGFPPGGSTWTLSTAGHFCRKFTPLRPCSATVAVVTSGGVYSVGGRMPQILRTSSGEHIPLNRDACAVNLFVFLSGRAAANQDCLDGFASEGGDQNHNVGNPYIPLGNACGSAENYIRCIPDPADPPRFVESDNFPYADPHRRNIYNNTLALVWSRGWPDESQPGGDLNFDVLEHYANEFGNGGIGVFDRSYNPTLSDRSQYVSVKEFPNSRTRWGDLKVHASLIVRRIVILLQYAPIKVREHPVDGQVTTIQKFAYPFAAVDVRVDYGIRINSMSGTGLIERPWTDPPTSVPVVLTEGSIDQFPTVSPDGNRLIYIDAAGMIVEPPTHFIWRGLLGRLTQPSSDEQKKPYDTSGGIQTLGQKFITAASGNYVGGQPALLETNPAEPNQMYGGRLLLTFKDTPGYRLCLGL